MNTVQHFDCRPDVKVFLVPNGTKVESLEQNNRFSPSILYTALACTHARALEYILSELSFWSSTRAVRMYVFMCSEVCLCISFLHPQKPTFSLRALLKFWRARYIQHNTKGRFNRAHWSKSRWFNRNADTPRQRFWCERKSFSDQIDNTHATTHIVISTAVDGSDDLKIELWGEWGGGVEQNRK